MFGIFFRACIILYLALLQVLSPIKVKQKFSAWKQSLSDQILGEELIKIGHWGYKTNIMLYGDFGKYALGEKASTKRMIWIILTRMSCLLVAAKFALNAYFDTPLTRLVLPNWIYSLSNNKLISLLISCGFFVTLAMGTVVLYQELTHNLKAYEFFDAVINNKQRIQLSHSKERRLTLAIHLINEYFLRQYYIISLVLSNTSFYFLLITGYFDSEGGFSLFWNLIWVVPMYLSFQQVFALLSVGSCFWVFCAYYLNYAFIDIENSLRLCLKSRNPRLLKKAIV